MSELMEAVFKMLIGVVNRDGDIKCAMDIIAGKLSEMSEFVGVVEEALFRSDIEIYHRWEAGRGGLHLRLWTDADLGVVDKLVHPFVDGCSLRYVGVVEDYNARFEDEANWLIDWDGDTFSKFGWVTLSPVPGVEWDGVVEPDFEKMGLGY